MSSPNVLHCLLNLNVSDVAFSPCVHAMCLGSINTKSEVEFGIGKYVAVNVNLESEEQKGI